MMPRYQCQPNDISAGGRERIITAPRPFHAAKRYRKATGYRGKVLVIPVAKIAGTFYPRTDEKPEVL